MADTTKLGDMLDDMIANKPEQANVDFRDYLQPKMKEVLGIQLPTADEETNDETD